MEKHLMTPDMSQKAQMMKKKWFRQLVLLIPTITGKRSSNKTEDYGVFQPSKLSHLDQLSMYVTDIQRSRKWYETVAGMTHSRTCDPEPHPTNLNRTIKCCYMSAKSHDECLVLIEQYDTEGVLIKPTCHGFFHTAFELEGSEFIALDFDAQVRPILEAHNYSHVNYGVVRHNAMPPHGDGETGGNTACYIYDDDFHNIEFFSGMDTVENYKERYGDKKGAQRL
jgi:catechol 2,3-dioxygenase-like lactoylglutathione lyase family enzyme